MDRPVGSSPASTVATVTVALREMILDGQVAPGQRLTTEGLAAVLGVSRAPVREALRALAGQGLVELQDRRGARVVDADAPPAAALIEIIEVRRHLEPWAAAEAASRAGPLVVDELHRLVDRGASIAASDPIGAGRVHHDLLLRIVEAADHPMLVATCRPLIDRTAIVFRRLDPADLPDGWAAHRATIAAIAAGDRRAAASSTRRHLDDVIAALRRS